MSRRIEAVKRGARRRRRTLAAVVVSIAALGVFTISALAVHDLNFQLDGDVLASTTTNVGGHTQNFDWDSLFDASGGEKTLPAGFEASVFHKDFNNVGNTFSTNDNDTFATGSKDTLPITPGWQCNRDANVNSKIDIMNAYSAAYTDDRGTVSTLDDHDILYFALERNANTGDGNVGFWFLQDGTVGCESLGGSVPFTGNHQTGDLLIVSAFTNGGAVSTIDVYRWVGGANGSLNPNPIAHGVDCKSTGGGDTACATVNTGTITTPWLTSNKQDGVGHSLRISEFFEGGLDLTAAGISGVCFNTFMGVTRSSQSLTATLFDYALGQLGECTSTTVTTPKKGDGTTTITEEPIPATGTLAVKDSATVTVNGADTWSGTVTFYLCGPDALTSTGSCTTGGVQIGTAKNVSNPSPATVTSDAAQLTSAGRYCWRAEFTSATTGVPNSKDDSTGECFKVTPLQPSLVTTATTGPVDFGNPITDVVALSGTANQEGTDGIGPGGTINATRGGGAGGTIHVDVYGPDSCAATDIVHSANLTVSGDGNYGGTGTDLEFTPTAPGEYVFVASYTGDAPNTLGITETACASQPDAEKVTVRQIPTQIKTKQSWFPNDTATITADTGNLAAGGKVLFELFDNATCDGDAVFSEEVTLTGGANFEEVGTDNTTYEITTGYGDAADSLVGRHSWRVTYTPDATDTAHTGRRSACDAEHFNITYTNDAGPGSVFP